MKPEQRDRIDNHIVSISEFDANKNVFRSPTRELCYAITLCDDLSSQSYELTDIKGRYGMHKWDPLDEESETILAFDHKLVDYLISDGSGLELDDSSESDEARKRFLSETLEKVRIVKELAEIIRHLLNTKASPYESHSQRRLRAIIDDFKQIYADEEVFEAENGVVERLYMYELTDFIDFYQQTVLSERKYNEAGFYEEIPVDIESHEQISYARKSFIARLPSLYERGLITEAQLERAVQICENIDIQPTDPLSEVYYKRLDTEELGLGYFLLNDRVIRINGDLIRTLILKEHNDDEPTVRQERIRHAVTKTVYHELIHAISNTWYSSFQHEAPGEDFILGNVEFDEEGNVKISDNITKTRYISHSLFPRFMDEAVTEIMTQELFQQTHGDTPVDYTYLHERTIISKLFEKIEWHKAGIDEAEAKVLLLKAFFDSASQVDDVKRPVNSYVQFHRALHIAADSGIVKRMAKIDSLFGAEFLLAIVSSDNFDASKSLAIENYPTAQLLRSMNYYAGLRVTLIEGHPDEYRQRARHLKHRRARKLKEAYDIFIKANKREFVAIYGLDKEKYLQPTPKDRLLSALFGEDPGEHVTLKQATEDLAARITSFLKLFSE